MASLSCFADVPRRIGEAMSWGRVRIASAVAIGPSVILFKRPEVDRSKYSISFSFSSWPSTFEAGKL